jgi:signal transduction histidine kinase
MPATPHPPSRPSGGSNRGSNPGESSGARRHADWQRDGGHAAASSLATPISDLFPEALEGAVALTRANGGELALLDMARQVVVVRARSTGQHRAQLASGFGVPGRPSQPYAAPAPPSGPRSGFPGLAREHDVRSSPSRDPEIEEQSTVLLPAIARTYACRLGEGLIGQAWQRGEPVVMRGDEYRAAGPGAPAAESPWHLAVPIFRPGTLYSLRPGTEVVGVLAVHHNDPHWSYSPRDIESLQLHADRVGRALHEAELARQHHSQSELLDLLRGTGGQMPQPQAVFERIRDLVRQVVDAPSFALALYHPNTNDFTFEAAERDNRPVTVHPVPAGAMPPWWRSVQRGESLRIALAEDRTTPPEYGVLGWGGDQHVPSLLAAPLIVGPALLGAIVVGSARPDAYGPEHVRLFETIAHTGAIVLEHERLSEEMRRSLAQNRERAHQLAALNNAVLTLNASLDLNATLHALVKQASLLTTAQYCLVLLADEEEDCLVGQAEGTNSGELRSSLHGVRVPMSWRGVGSQLRGGQFIIMDNLTDEWQDTTSIATLLRDQRISSCLMLPIMHQDQRAPQIGTPQPDTLLGALLVFTPGQRQHFPPEQIGLLQGLASQAGVAISNASLYRDLQQAYERQKELDRLKDEFILTISHEFRTPLTTIDGYVTLIGRHGLKLDPERLTQYATEIRQATSQLAGMISMLADANRMSDHLLELTLVPVNARAAAEKAISTQAPEAKARITLDIAPDFWAQADEERLPLVFSNLLSNAIKYSGENTPIRIAVRQESQERLLQDGRLRHARANVDAQRWIVVGVRDQGIGISPEDQKKLFQKFVRLSHSLTSSVRGTGLGLWICKSYVEAMGGDIWVESARGQGSLFQFCLPVAEPRPQ